MARKLPPGFEENIEKKKKKKLPFHGKAEGPAARRRADRKAMRRGGNVRAEGLADGEPESPHTPNAPKGGAERQYQFGGRVTRAAMRSQYHGGPLRERTTTTTVHHRDPHPVTGLKKGGETEDEDEKDEKAEKRKAGGHITAAGRRALPSSDFALPGKGKGPQGKGSGSYPIDTPGRARAALSRGAHNASPAEQATIKRKVKAKYPSMDVSE